MSTDEPRSSQTPAFAPSDEGAQPPRLNTDLHQRLLLEGGAKASTLESAMEALRRIRLRRESAITDADQ